jgi:hypothetical protein
MSFLDNLESNLKSLESAEEGREDKERSDRGRTHERAQALAAAPFAEELKKSPYTAELLKQAARIGFAMRVKVHVAWLGTSLRLEARERRLQLNPTAAGIVAAYSENGQETRSGPIELTGDPAELVKAWLA